MKDAGKDITGNTFGKLTVKKYVGKILGNKSTYLCKCSCGTYKRIRKTELTRKNGTKSCGCSRNKFKATHGLSGTRIYSIYKSMMRRCYSSNHHSYLTYGGRGVKVCTEWVKDPLEFVNWAFSNGYADNLECDRINNDKGYSPKNCQFISHRDNISKRGKQANNTSGFIGVRESYNNKWRAYIVVNGKPITIQYCASREAAAMQRDNYVITNSLKYTLNFNYFDTVSGDCWAHKTKNRG